MPEKLEVYNSRRRVLAAAASCFTLLPSGTDRASRKGAAALRATTALLSEKPLVLQSFHTAPTALLSEKLLVSSVKLPDCACYLAVCLRRLPAAAAACCFTLGFVNLDRARGREHAMAHPGSSEGHTRKAQHRDKGLRERRGKVFFGRAGEARFAPCSSWRRSRSRVARRGSREPRFRLSHGAEGFAQECADPRTGLPG